ncbi:MAG TPA: helix-hairpin-helix domain-containing protein [Gemmataceae bacterium]|nr:helix-hairpin-helix domain-containing protein [Gemmataceae bacterium]
MDAPSPGTPPSAPARQEPRVYGAWPRSAQLATAFLLGLATALLAVHGFGYLRWRTRPTQVDPAGALAYRIDLNQAGRAELLQIPGIGNGLAERIVEYRQEHGIFRNVNELTGVKGIGPTTIETVRPWVRVEAIGADQGQDEAKAMDRRGSSRRPGSRPSSSSKEASLKGPIDINRATAEELQRLPGIGPKMSQRIIEERQKGPFQSVSDLKRVQGIGPKTLERLRPHVVVESNKVRVVAVDSER